jgi:hypothetical protein
MVMPSENNKNPNEKQLGENPEGKYHFNPGNMAGKKPTLKRNAKDYPAFAVATICPRCATPVSLSNKTLGPCLPAPRLPAKVDGLVRERVARLPACKPPTDEVGCR